MTENDEKIRKRVCFIQSDVQLLLDCVKSQAHILENKQTNKVTPEIKRKGVIKYFCSL